MSLQKDRGIALVSVLLLTVVISMMVVSISNRLQIDVHRSAYLSSHQQAAWYALSAENWARRVLDDDDPTVDSLDEDWALNVRELPIEEGVVAGQLIDSQSRLNLNGLLIGDHVDQVSFGRLSRLFKQLGIDGRHLNALVDWIDRDSIARDGGAEDEYYATLSPAYRSANDRLADFSELLLVKGFNEVILDKLRPYLVVLPEPTPINVNTASPELLEVLFSDRSLDVSGTVQRRNSKPYSSLEEFFSLALTGDTVGDRERAGIAVSSNYFHLHTTVELGPYTLHQNALLVRKNRRTVSSRRWRGGA